MHKLIIAAGIGLAALQPSAAGARQADGFIVTIPVYDLDLASNDGASALRDRAATAARSACDRDMRQLRDIQETRECRRAFRAKVESRLRLASMPLAVMASR
jgi:UrcA family protein